MARGTSLNPAMEEWDPETSIDENKTIPEGGGFKVLGKQVRRKVIWYKVAAISASKRPIGQGYVSSKALSGQRISRYGVMVATASNGTAEKPKPPVKKPKKEVARKPVVEKKVEEKKKPDAACLRSPSQNQKSRWSL